MTRLTLSAAEFEARCTELLGQIDDGDIGELVVTRKGQVIARLVPPGPPAMSFAEWRASMAGTVHIPPGFDLTEPAYDGPWDVELPEPDPTQ